MAILGLGVDLVEVARFEREEARHGPGFLQAVFSPAEIARCGRRPDPPRAWATHFAAKEAVLKALGTGLTGRLSWHDIEIDLAGAIPLVALGGEASRLAATMGAAGVELTITRTAAHAAVMAVLVGGQATTHPAGPDHSVEESI